MTYSLESVTTITSTGKSRKGAILQATVKQFEHTILVGDEAVSALICQLKALIYAVNARYPGKPVVLQHSTDSGHIYANNGYTGSEGYIFSISFAPVGDDLRYYNIRSKIAESVENIDRELLSEYNKCAYKVGEIRKEGGDK